MQRQCMAGHGCPRSARLSEFCCDGKAAGGPLLSLYSIRVKPGRLFHFWHALGYLCGAKREWFQE